MKQVKYILRKLKLKRIYIKKIVKYFIIILIICMIIVLGAGVLGDKLSPMLEDRLLEAINLYNNNVSSKIIMSGDHGRKEYDEVNIMYF